MQASRLLSILMTLQLEGRTSARELARALEVSVRTIHRDIDALSAAGVPVYAERGRAGGFRLRDGYRTKLTGLDRPEAESLFFAGLPSAATQLGLGPAVARVRQKLLAALPDEAARDARRVLARFHVDPVAWFQGPDAPAVLPDLARAVWLGRVLSMRYESWRGVVERRVAPLGLVLKAGLWYLVAASGTQPRTYRVGAILTLQVEAEEAPAPRRFDLQAYWARFARDYERRMQAGRARVRARPAALRALARLSHAMSESVRAAGPCDAAGWHTFTVPIESVEVAVGELLRIGPSVEALAPASLREALRKAAAELAALYAVSPRRSKKA